MKLISVALVFLITQLSGWILCEQSSKESHEDLLKDFKKCPGGYCIQTYLCQNGTLNVDGDNILQERMDDYPIYIEVNQEDDPCDEFLKVCCPLGNAPKSRNDLIRSADEDPIQSPPRCGTNIPDGFLYRVKNSSLAQFAEFPWMAALLQNKSLLNKESTEYFCGGSLIHPSVVLTAAHCLRNRNRLDDILVRLGEWDLVTENEPLAYQQYGVSKTIIHENFVDYKFHNDIALLILNDEAVLNKHINPICLPGSNDNFDGQRCIVSGWGKDPKGKYSEVLKKVEIPVVPRDQCKRSFKKTRLGPFFHLHSSFMCAGGEPGVDVCKGDGGSPLACKSGNQFVQTGIVAWGLGCGDDGVPGAYVKVSNFVDWIQTTLQRENIEIL